MLYLYHHEISVCSQKVRLALADSPTVVIGDYLEVARVEGEPVIRCARCGHTFCSAAQTPKKFAATAQVPYRTAGPLFPDERNTKFFLREFYCPGCATRFEVEVADDETPVLHDIELRC